MFNPGDKVILTDASLFSTYDSKKVEEKISGEYFIYSATERNNRIRITDDISKVAKPACCTGWIRLSDCH